MDKVNIINSSVFVGFECWAAIVLAEAKLNPQGVLYVSSLSDIQKGNLSSLYIIRVPSICLYSFYMVYHLSQSFINLSLCFVFVFIFCLYLLPTFVSLSLFASLSLFISLFLSVLKLYRPVQEHGVYQKGGGGVFQELLECFCQLWEINR